MVVWCGLSFALYIFLWDYLHCRLTHLSVPCSLISQLFFKAGWPELMSGDMLRWSHFVASLCPQTSIQWSFTKQYFSELTRNRNEALKSGKSTSIQSCWSESGSWVVRLTSVQHFYRLAPGSCAANMFSHLFNLFFPPPVCPYQQPCVWLAEQELLFLPNLLPFLPSTCQSSRKKSPTQQQPPCRVSFNSIPFN